MLTIDTLHFSVYATRMRKAYKYRIYLTKGQRRILEQQLEECRYVYNQTLQARRKIPAETLIQIARLCGKPLGFFEPAEQTQIAELAAVYPERSDVLPAEAPALQALTNALQLRPDAIPMVMEFLEAWLNDQAVHADDASRRREAPL